MTDTELAEYRRFAITVIKNEARKYHETGHAILDEAEGLADQAIAEALATWNPAKSQFRTWVFNRIVGVRGIVYHFQRDLGRTIRRRAWAQEKQNAKKAPPHIYCMSLEFLRSWNEGDEKCTLDWEPPALRGEWEEKTVAHLHFQKLCECLPPIEQQVVEDWVMGMTNRESGKHLGCSIKHINYLRKKAKQRMRAVVVS